MFSFDHLGWILFALAGIAALFLAADNQALRFDVRQKTAARDGRGRFRAKDTHATAWRGR